MGEVGNRTFFWLYFFDLIIVYDLKTASDELVYLKLVMDNEQGNLNWYFGWFLKI